MSRDPSLQASSLNDSVQTKSQKAEISTASEAPVVSGALHTPTPWRAARNDHYWEIHGGDHGQIGDVCASKFIYVDGDKLPSCEAELIAEANAALIVRAVNSHEALVKALKQCQRIIERDFPNGQLAKDIRAALAAANTVARP